MFAFLLNDAGVYAAGCPDRKQPERYVQYALIFRTMIQMILKNIYNEDKIY
jgi:hypothetical protein